MDQDLVAGDTTGTGVGVGVAAEAGTVDLTNSVLGGAPERRLKGRVGAQAAVALGQPLRADEEGDEGIVPLLARGMACRLSARRGPRLGRGASSSTCTASWTWRRSR